jgi:hypothetical protein
MNGGTEDQTSSDHISNYPVWGVILLARTHLSCAKLGDVTHEMFLLMLWGHQAPIIHDDPGKLGKLLISEISNQLWSGFLFKMKVGDQTS